VERARLANEIMRERTNRSVSVVLARPPAAAAAALGFGHIVVSGIEVPNFLANMV
jgi:hypothetical protein